MPTTNAHPGVLVPFLGAKADLLAIQVQSENVAAMHRASRGVKIATADREKSEGDDGARYLPICEASREQFV